jgi:hypothetical protein
LIVACAVAAMNQLELIAEKLGKPPESFITRARKPIVRNVFVVWMSLSCSPLLIAVVCDGNAQYRTKLRELPDTEGDLLSHFENANPLGKHATTARVL